MRYDFFISPLDSHNQESILLSEALKPRKIIYVYQEEDSNLDKLEALKFFYKEKFSGIEIGSVQLENISLQEVVEKLTPYLEKKAIINLNGENNFLNIIFTHVCETFNVEGVSMEIDRSRILTIKNKKISISSKDFMDLNIGELIKSFGGRILLESTNISEDKVMKKIASVIGDNLDLWEKSKYKLYDKEIFITDEGDSNLMRINLLGLNEEDRNVCLVALKYLQDNGYISYKVNKTGAILVNFINYHIKGFIFKSGSWLETYVQQIIAEIKEIDEVKSGVLFLWSDEKHRVKNEIDVMAIKDSELICISCKDSAKYGDVALNELNVYSEKLGGDNVKKILVATKSPLKASVLDRAKEMDIALIIFNGDRLELKRQLEYVIKK